MQHRDEIILRKERISPNIMESYSGDAGYCCA